MPRSFRERLVVHGTSSRPVKGKDHGICGSVGVSSGGPPVRGIRANQRPRKSGAEVDKHFAFECWFHQIVRSIPIKPNVQLVQAQFQTVKRPTKLSFNQ